MLDIAENGFKKKGLNGQTNGNGWKWFDMAQKGWKLQKMAGISQKQLETARNSGKWLEMSGNG